MASCQELADRGGPEMGPSAEARPGVAEDAADGAPRGGCVSQEAQRIQDWPASFGAPSPSLCFERGKWNEGDPGASKNTGDGACP
jgi:hypothetical protein